MSYGGLNINKSIKPLSRYAPLESWIAAKQRLTEKKV